MLSHDHDHGNMNINITIMKNNITMVLIIPYITSLLREIVKTSCALVLFCLAQTTTQLAMLLIVNEREQDLVASKSCYYNL